jgi:GTP-binding protein
MRGFIMKDMKIHEATVRMIFEGPTRGIFGYRGQFMIDTRGQGIMATRFLEFRPCWSNPKTINWINDNYGNRKSTCILTWKLQDRGVLLHWT